MAIIRKDRIEKALAELDEYYGRLRTAIEGEPPSANLSHAYGCEADQFAREFADVDLDRVEMYIKHFQIAVDGVKKLKAYRAQRLHQG